MNSFDLSNCIQQIHGHFIKAIEQQDSIKKELRTDVKLAEIKTALGNVRNSAEAICKHIVYDKYTPAVIYGDDGLLEKKFYNVIESLSRNKYFHSNEDKNKIRALDFHRLRFGGNAGSHVSALENTNPDFQDYEHCKLILKQQIKWFYIEYKQTVLPPEIKNIIETDEIKATEQTEYEDWYSFASQYGNFQAKNTQYILISAPNFRQQLSEYQMRELAKSNIDWHLVIDFDPDSQATGICKYFNEELGIENIGIFTKTKSEIDFSRPLTYWYRAQETPAAKLQLWNITYGSKLTEIISKSKIQSNHKHICLICLSDEYTFINAVLERFSQVYSPETSKIKIGIICNQKTDEPKAKQIIDAFDGIFSRIEYHTFSNYSQFIKGAALNKRDNLNTKGQFIIPAFSEKRTSDYINIIFKVYAEFKTQHFMEIIHKDIGQPQSETENIDFYLGNQVTWEDLAWRKGRIKGRDINRSKFDIIVQDLQGLLLKGKGCYILELLHEPSAGGTTIARRISYELGTMEHPTVLIYKYHTTLTYRGIERLYELTNDKPILAIIESHQVGQTEINLLKDQINKNNKHVVILYVKQTFVHNQDEKQNKRVIESALDDDEAKEFEITYSSLKPERKMELQSIRNIYKNDRDFITPFIFGITAYEKEFSKLESYVEAILRDIGSDKNKNFVAYICLIGKYIQNPIPESVFYGYLGILDLNLKITDVITEKLLFKLLKCPSENNWEKRHKLVADEVCLQMLSGGNLRDKHLWRSGLKNWFIELINIFKRENPSKLLYDADKEILEALFIDKKNIPVDEYKSTTASFSKLINEFNENGEIASSRDILKHLCESFPDHPYFKQHLARLYNYSAKKSENPKFYDIAIEEATQSVNLQPHDATLYHTKGYIILSKIRYIYLNYRTIVINKDKFLLESEIQEMYETASEAFTKCIEIDINSNHGYSSYIYLVTTILDFGRQHSGYAKFEGLLNDGHYDWYIDKVQLGLDLIASLRDIQMKNETDNKGDIESINKSYSTLAIYIGKKPSYFADKEKERGISNELKIFYRNAFIIQTLKDKDFANPHNAWSKLNSSEIALLVEKLKANIRYEPKIYDIKRYFQAIRVGKYFEALRSCREFLEEIYERAKNNKKNVLILGELSYYLYILNAIQEVNEGEKLDNTYFKNTIRYLEDCKQQKSHIKRDLFEFEWLGKNKKAGLEQMINRKELGDFDFQEFTEKIENLQEVKGMIVSVGLENKGEISERKKGFIQFNQRGKDECFKAFFTPIKGGVTENADGSLKKWMFDDKKYENNQEVMFYLGFSYSGFRAWQPIPVNAKRAIPSKSLQADKKEVPTYSLVIDDHYDFRVKSVDNKQHKIIGKIKGIEEDVKIAFENGKSYDDYKHLRRDIIKVKYNGESFSLV